MLWLQGRRAQLSPAGHSVACDTHALGAAGGTAPPVPTCIVAPQAPPPAGLAQPHVQHLVPFGIVHHPGVPPLAAGAALQQELAAAAVPYKLAFAEAAAAAGHAARQRERGADGKGQAGSGAKGCQVVVNRQTVGGLTQGSRDGRRVGQLVSPRRRQWFPPLQLGCRPLLIGRRGGGSALVGSGACANSEGRHSPEPGDGLRVLPELIQ